MKRVRSLQPAYSGRPEMTVFELEDADADAMISAGWVEETDADLTVEPEAEAPLEELKVDELKDKARAEGKPVSGTKSELLERLSEEEE